MCGIFGIVRKDKSGIDPLVVSSMSDRLLHRGPDEQGAFQESSVTIGNTRLAIIDPENGIQPIYNDDRSKIIVFNGEIYNHRELRATLQSCGYTFKSHVDTEVVLRAYEEYGEDCVHHFNGMFALAIWDVTRQELFLARDRLGIKPLYVLDGHDALIFASEPKAILAATGTSPSVDWNAVSLFFTLGYFPLRDTPYEDLEKLPGGHTATFSKTAGLIQKRFWAPKFGSGNINFNDAVAAVQETAKKSVEYELESDVPVGVFLSGGLDSAFVADNVRQLRGDSLSTFSLGFEEHTHDETDAAQEIARCLGLKHESIRIQKSDLRDSLDEVSASLDEPFGDATVVPLLHLSKFARQHVKVALTGWGGDEIFAGYPTYKAHTLSHWYRNLPSILRDQLIPQVIKKIPPSDKYMSFEFKLKRFISGADRPRAEQHLLWMRYLTGDETTEILNPDISNHIKRGALSNLIDQVGGLEDLEPVDMAMQLDMMTFLDGNGLYQADRMMMAASLEGRVPLLNNLMIDLAMRIPSKVKMHNGSLKAILRTLLRGRLPDSIVNLPKKGFGPPSAAWLRTTFRDQLEDQLSSERLARDGFFNVQRVRAMVEDHMQNKRDHGRALWMLMSFQLWYKNRIV